MTHLTSLFNCNKIIFSHVSNNGNVSIYWACKVASLNVFGDSLTSTLFKIETITPIRRIAVRETSISRHNHVYPIEDTPCEAQHSILLKSLRGALIWAPIMPRDTSFSDSRCQYFRSLACNNVCERPRR